MPIQPIDVQTLFMRLSQIGKEQSLQRDAAHIAQTAQGTELAREAEEHAKTVNVSRELEDGPDAIKEEQQEGGEEGQNERSGAEPEPEAQAEVEVFSDPDLGNTIDISG